MSWNPILMHGEKHLWWGWSRICNIWNDQAKPQLDFRGKSTTLPCKCRSYKRCHAKGGSVAGSARRGFRCQEHTWGTSGISPGPVLKLLFSLSAAEAASLPLRSREGERHNSAERSCEVTPTLCDSPCAAEMVLLVMLCPPTLKAHWRLLMAGGLALRVGHTLCWYRSARSPDSSTLNLPTCPFYSYLPRDLCTEHCSQPFHNNFIFSKYSP